MRLVRLLRARLRPLVSRRSAGPLRPGAPRVSRARPDDRPPAMDGVPLDDLVTRLLSRAGFEYRLAMDDTDRDIAFRIRGETVLRQGWCEPRDLPGGRER